MLLVKSLGVGIGVVASVCYGCYEYKRMNNSHSLIYLGQNKAFEAQLDLHLGVPVSQMIPLVTKFHFISSLYPLISNASSTDDEARETTAALFGPANDLREQFPRSFLGDLLAFYAARRCGDVELAQAHLQQAHRIAEQNPDWTQPLAHLLPPEDRLEAPSWQPVWTEVVPDRLWTISTHTALPRRPASPRPLISSVDAAAPSAWGLETRVDVEEVASGVLRLGTGELAVINPGQFDTATIEQINALGLVKSVFVPTHQECTASILEFVDQTWPRAQKLEVPNATTPIGVEAAAASSLPSSSSTTEQQTRHVEHLGNGELTGIRIEGIMISNAVMHADTGTMFGLPAMCTRRSRNQGDYPALVDFAMGQHRGELSSTPFDPPSYLWCVLSDPLAFRSSVLSYIDQQATCQRILPAQGDALPAGDIGRRQLMLAYGWILGPDGINYCFSTLDQVFMQVAWVSQHRLWPVVFTVAKRFIHRVFDRPAANKSS